MVWYGIIGIAYNKKVLFFIMKKIKIKAENLNFEGHKNIYLNFFQLYHTTSRD